MEKHLLPGQQELVLDLHRCQTELAVLQKLLNSSLDVICTIDAEGKFTYVSSAAKQVLGYEPGELIGRRYMDLVHPEDHPKTIAAAGTVMSGVDVLSFENRYINKDGFVVPLIWSARWSAEDQNVYCVAKNATALKEAEKAKYLQEKRLNRAYNLAGLAWWEYDVSTQTYTSSDEIFYMYGLPIPEKNQTTLEEFFSYVHPDDVARLQHDLTTLGSDTYANYEHRIVKPSGEVIHVMHYAEAIRDHEGNPVALHGTTKEITESKYYFELEKLERQILELSARTATPLVDILNTYAKGIEFLHEGIVCSISENLNGKVHVLAAPSFPASFLAALKDGVHIANDNGSCGTAAFLKKKVLVSDIANDPRWADWKDVALSHNFKACWSTPILDSEENVMGVFALYYSTVKLPSSLEENTVERATNILQIILENHKKTQALRLANERFELVSKATRDALWDWDIETNNCYFNESYTTSYGYANTADYGYTNWMDNIHEADKKRILESLADVLNNTAALRWEGEYRFIRQDRSTAQVLDRSYIIRDAEGRAVRMVGTMQDVTTLVEAEEERKKLSLVAKETMNAVVITDAEERITWVNKAFSDITGYTFEEAIGKKPADLLQGPKTSEKTKAYIQRCIQKKKPFNCEIINYTKSGREYWMEIKGQPIFDEKGQLKQFFAIQTDISKRKEAEIVITLSEEKYKRLFYNSPRPNWIFDAETMQVVDVNDAVVELYGYSREELLQMKIGDLKPAEDEPELVAAVKSLKGKKNGYFNKIVRHKKKSGEVFSIEITSFTIQLPTGTHIMSSGTDMTEKLQLQQRLVAEKVDAQKKVARAIIQTQETERGEIGKELHDNVCQLLTTAKLYMENIRYFPDQQEKYTAKGVELIMKSINEIRYLSKQLVSPVLNDIGFEATVIELVSHYKAMNLFEVCFDYEAKIELVDKDLKTSIIRILQEQFNNTVKYARASEVRVSISNSNEVVILRYEDNGIGFDPHQVKHGIGLSNIHNRANAYRGKVKLNSAIGKGYKMEIAFPLTDTCEISKPEAVCFY